MLSDVRATAVTIGKIAGVLHAWGEWETALKMRQEQERPIYEKLGEARELAICLGRIADSLRSLGQLDEAIRLRSREQMPSLRQLGVAYDLLFAQESLARLLLDRGGAGDRDEAVRLLQEAREAAVRLRLPEEERMRSLLAEVAAAEPR
jgi:tetratricopeptide (TPR) repeat protein